MQHLEVSCAVRRFFKSLGCKGLIRYTYVLLLTYFREILIYFITKLFIRIFTEIPTDDIRLEN